MTDREPSVATLNDVSKHDYMHVLGDIVEHSPWVAECAFAKRPFVSLDDIKDKLIACVRAASLAEQLALFNQHPELAGQEAVAGSMTESSTSEQARLGLTSLSPPQFERLTRLNRAYRTKFGFPYIAAVRLHPDLESVMHQCETRTRNTLDAEVEQTLQQISEIVYGRLCRIFGAGPA